jgi:hypothetical protein
MKNQKDFFAGLIFVAFGAIFALGATAYRMGEAARMGPGYFPFLLGCLLAALGLALLAGSLFVRAKDGAVERLHLRPVVLVLGPIAAFALLLRPAGVVVAIVALIMISSRASDEYRPKEAILNTVVLIAASLAIFVWGLNLQFPIWPKFIGR